MSKKQLQDLITTPTPKHTTKDAPTHKPTLLSGQVPALRNVDLECFV